MHGLLLMFKDRNDTPVVVKFDKKTGSIVPYDADISIMDMPENEWKKLKEAVEKIDKQKKQALKNMDVETKESVDWLIKAISESFNTNSRTSTAI